MRGDAISARYCSMRLVLKQYQFVSNYNAKCKDCIYTCMMQCLAWNIKLSSVPPVKYTEQPIVQSNSKVLSTY
jgi:hypothetical protein